LQGRGQALQGRGQALQCADLDASVLLH
jgi:hypothetical protein